MATRAFDLGRAPALPLEAVLAAIPSYPRPVIERLVCRMIDHLDDQDGDPDLEDDEPAGGSVDDEGENVASAWAMPRCTYGADQRDIIGSRGLARWRVDRDD